MIMCNKEVMISQILKKIRRIINYLLGEFQFYSCDNNIFIVCDGQYIIMLVELNCFILFLIESKYFKPLGLYFRSAFFNSTSTPSK